METVPLETAQVEGRKQRITWSLELVVKNKEKMQKQKARCHQEDCLI